MNFDLSDIKGAINKAKAVALGLTEYEQKVKEATSSEAWGASSTLMQELAKGTYDYQGFNEIMPAIYKRFSQEGKTWRNIYKALTLLEYLIKNGSERVVSYMREHTYEIKACLNYQFTDDKGKDQGINIRHRAKLILDLLQDEAKIRDERAKAAENRNKYGGVGSDGSRSGGFGNNANNSRYGGFGSSSASSGYPGQYGSGSTSAYSPDSPSGPSALSGNQESFGSTSAPAPVTAAPPAAPPKPVVADLLGFDEPAAPPGGAGTPDDEWADFASANNPSSPPKPAPAQAHAGFAAFTVPASSAPQQSGGFVAFSQPQPTQPAVGGFAAFNAPPPVAAQPAGGFAAFSSASAAQPAPTNNSGFADFGAFESAPAVNTQQSQLQQQQQNNPASPGKPANPMWNTNLVNLDALSNFGQSKTQTPTGPSMNSLAAANLRPQQQQPSPAAGGGFAAFPSTAGPGQQQQAQFAAFGQPQQQQRPPQQNGGGNFLL